MAEIETWEEVSEKLIHGECLPDTLVDCMADNMPNGFACDDDCEIMCATKWLRTNKDRLK